MELFLAALAALAIVLAYRLALRVVPDPWSIGAALAVGLNPAARGLRLPRSTRSSRRQRYVGVPDLLVQRVAKSLMSCC